MCFIQVYDYKQVITDVVDMHYPISEMCCESKISCIAWNPYHKSELVSSDYEGIMTMWDPFTAKRIQVFQVNISLFTGKHMQVLQVNVNKSYG